MYYLSTSKVAIAVLGNFAFAVALCTYFLLTKVPSHSCLYMTKAHAWLYPALLPFVHSAS